MYHIASGFWLLSPAGGAARVADCHSRVAVERYRLCDTRAKGSPNSDAIWTYINPRSLGDRAAADSLASRSFNPAPVDR
ncbi:MAG TPA: hypothetical protein VF898_09340 [Chloroflexota bacterium]